MSEDIWELAGHARKKGIKMALSINGTLITPKVACRIRESPINVYSWDTESYLKPSLSSTGRLK